jgi:hypothetical protein
MTTDAMMTPLRSLHARFTGSPFESVTLEPSVWMGRKVSVSLTTARQRAHLVLDPAQARALAADLLAQADKADRVAQAHVPGQVYP